MGFWKTGHQRVLKSCIIYCWVFLYQVSMVMGSAGTEKRVWVCLVLGDVFVPWPKILLEVYARLEPQATIIYFDVAILLLLLTWRFGQSHWLWGSQLLKIESMVLPPAHQPFTGNHKYWKWLPRGWASRLLLTLLWICCFSLHQQKRELERAENSPDWMSLSRKELLIQHQLLCIKLLLKTFPKFMQHRDGCFGPALYSWNPYFCLSRTNYCFYPRNQVHLLTWL